MAVLGYIPVLADDTTHWVPVVRALEKPPLHTGLQKRFCSYTWLSPGLHMRNLAAWRAACCSGSTASSPGEALQLRHNQRDMTHDHGGTARGKPGSAAEAHGVATHKVTTAAGLQGAQQSFFRRASTEGGRLARKWGSL